MLEASRDSTVELIVLFFCPKQGERVAFENVRLQLMQRKREIRRESLARLKRPYRTMGLVLGPSESRAESRNSSEQVS